MEHISPFAQRLKAISARRKLQELILSTRLDLEQEKLRTQRLKRKSLREQWLMEGTSASPGDRDPLSPLREAEARIEELQQSLTSLQIQMQQLDDLETRKVMQKPPSEEPVRDVGKVNQAPEGPEEVDMTASSSSKGRSEAESTLVSAPALPQRPMSTEVNKNLQNGGMQDGDLFSHERGPEEAKAEAIPGALEKGELWPHQGDSVTASVANPAGQSSDPGKAPVSRQRKLAMEEMLIRNHLGQEVGCMDAVGKNQSSLEKEEESEDPGTLEDSCESRSRPGPVDGISDRKEALGEDPLDRELGSCDGPAGETPTHQDHPSPSSLVQNENSYPKSQEDRPPETDSPTKEASGAEPEAGQEKVPEEGAWEEPALAPATGDAPVPERVKQNQGNPMPEQQELQATEKGQRQAKCSPRSQVDTEALVEQAVSPPPEVEPSLLECLPSSRHEMKSQQGEELLRQEVEGSLPDTTSSFTDQLSSLPDYTVPLQDATISALAESPEGPEERKPVPPEVQVLPRSDSDVFLPDQIPCSVDDPGERPVALQDQTLPVPQDTEFPCPAGENITSSPQEVDGALPDEIQTPLPNHANLPEEEDSGKDLGLPTSEEQATTSLLAQSPSSQEAAKTLPEESESSDLPEERSSLVGQTLSSDKAQSPILEGASMCPSILPPCTQESLQPLLDETEAVRNGDVRESGEASVGLAEAGETTEALEDLSSERQPLLRELTASGATLDVPVGDTPLKPGIFKPQAATSQQAPNHSSQTSANATSSHPPQADLPRQGDVPEPERSKRTPKSCQCCIVM